MSTFLFLIDYSKNLFQQNKVQSRKRKKHNRDGTEREKDYRIRQDKMIHTENKVLGQGICILNANKIQNDMHNVDQKEIISVQFQKTLLAQKETLQPLKAAPISLSWQPRKHQSLFCLCEFTLPGHFIIKGIRQYVTFYVWSLLLSTIFSSFFHAVVCISS